MTRKSLIEAIREMEAAYTLPPAHHYTLRRARQLAQMVSVMAGLPGAPPGLALLCDDFSIPVQRSTEEEIRHERT